MTVQHSSLQVKPDKHLEIDDSRGRRKDNYLPKLKDQTCKIGTAFECHGHGALSLI